MRKYSLSSLFDIQLFGDGAGSAAGTEGAGGESPAGQNTAALAQPQRGGKNPLAAVEYGKPEEEAKAPVAAEQKPAADRAEEFEKLIKGEFKDLFSQRIQETVSKRLKGNEETVRKYKALAPVLGMLSKKYGTAADDAAALAKAIEEDDAYYEEESIERNLPVEQIKAERRMKRENAELLERVKTLEEQENDRKIREETDRQVLDWVRQGEELKKIYPSFDLNAESQNAEFVQLLQAGIPVQTAFEVVHKDEILPAAMQFAANKAQEKVANAVLAGQRRPPEGAMDSRATTLRKTDVKQLTRADRDEIERRVARGEKIRF